MTTVLIIVGILAAIILYLLIGWFVNSEVNSDNWYVNAAIVVLWPAILACICLGIFFVFICMFLLFLKDKLGHN